MEHEGLLLCSQEPTTGLCPDPVESKSCSTGLWHRIVMW